MSDLQNVRHVALKLHAMHAADRAWLLEQLPAADRGIIHPLIEELDQLGIIHTAHLSGAEAVFPVGKYDLPKAATQIIDVVAWSAFESTFRSLPDRLRAMLLHARVWRWAGEAWAALDARERSSLLRHVGQLGEIRPAVMAALVDQLADALRTPHKSGYR